MKFYVLLQFLKKMKDSQKSKKYYLIYDDVHELSLYQRYFYYLSLGKKNKIKAKIAIFHIVQLLTQMRHLLSFSILFYDKIIQFVYKPSLNNFFK